MPDYKIELTFSVVPKFRGNDKEPSPATFDCKAISTSARQRLLKLSSGEGARVEIDLVGLFRESVTKIRNLQINGESIESPARFLQVPGMDEMMYEVVNLIQERMGVQDGKNS